MDVKEMREKLADVVDSVPRSNDDVKELYAEKFNVDIKDLDVIENEYTYIGSGDTPPHMTKFMGRQVFIRGEPTVVTDPAILKKIDNHPCFVKGKYEKDKLFENDELAKKRADKQREEDLKVQIAIDRQNKG